jgi:bifunctional non-homologous end joining protein LigD
MADALTAYRAKRDFETTPEPRGAFARRGAGLAFVIQKHAATRLHYDFRLELDGTLKSWAVPKGPSLDPADKRMAIHVEDHPLAYGGFEGTIPERQYGAGEVIVWDRGTWEPIGDARAGYAAGKLKFRLDGEKLHGTWALVKMHGRAGERQEPWLLIKERDDDARPASEYSVVDALPESVLTPGRTVEGREGAAAKAAAKKASAPSKASPTRTDKVASKGTRPKEPTAAAASKDARPKEAVGAAPPKKAAARSRKPSAGKATASASIPGRAVAAALPDALAPELATLVAAAPADESWAYEVKFDGYRVLARVEGDAVRLVTRNGNDWTAKLRPIAKEIAALGLGSAWLDGEIVVLGPSGASDFGALQNAFEGGGAEILYFVFDLPFFAGHDLRACRLEDRRALLASALGEATGKVRFSPDFQAEGSDIMKNACRLHLEGVIGKRLGSPYVGRRSADWIKLKCTLRQEFVIGGYTEPKGSRAGLGALLLGIHDERGRLRYAGNVGSGFDTRTLGELKKKLAAIETAQAPFFEKPREAKGTWVEPALIAEVSFAEWTRDGKVRQAVFHGLRADKPPTAIVREAPAPAPKGKRTEVSAEASAAPTSKKPPKAAAKRSKAISPVSSAAAPPTTTTSSPVRITHPERVIDPTSPHTKGELVDYYVHAARRLLPHLARRPVALVRAPEGIEGQLFFQKHSGSLRIRDIRTLAPELDPGHPPLIEIASFVALVSAAQMNVVEFHTWNATTRSIEKPDRMTFDLDPGEGVTWKTVVEAARLTRSVLEDLGLVAFVKTSGGKGLHIVVPLAPKDGWDAVKDFSHAVVDRLAALAPQMLVAKSGPRNRVGRIFVDYLRNGRGATTAAAFSARARPGLGVSVPCEWDELDGLRGGDHWNIANVHDRLESAHDPWAACATTKQALTAPRKTLKQRAAA